MKLISNGKVWIILLAFVALVVLVVLAAGLSGMEFDQPNMVRFDNLFRLSDSANPGNTPQFSWFRYFVIGMFILLFLAMLGPVRPQTSKGLLPMILRFFAFTFIVMLVVNQLARNNPTLFEGDDSLTPAPGSNAELPQFTQPQVTSQWELLITFVIVIAIAAVAIILFNRFVDKWFQPKAGLGELAEIARSTLGELSKNKESRNAIIRCYSRMNAAVNEHRGLVRDAAMTPAEFAERLERAGLPGDAVHGLTRVFERVRYGGENVSADEIKEAKNCLTSILTACESKP